MRQFTRNRNLHSYLLLKGEPPFLESVFLVTRGPLVRRACRPRLTLTHTSGLPSSLPVKLVHSCYIVTVD